MILLIFLAALIGSILIGLPICFALLFSGVCMMFGLNGFNSSRPIDLMAIRMISSSEIPVERSCFFRK